MNTNPTTTEGVVLPALKNPMSAEALEILRKAGLTDVASGFSKQNERFQSCTDKWLQLIITQNPEMIKLKEDIKILASHDAPVLIIGETGTGKELIAQALHGDRSFGDKKGKFVAINCAGIPETLLESTLFGYRKGTFTGANTDRSGLMEEAAYGTVFLDEIGDMPLTMQAKILRAIQEKTIMRVGDSEEREINCRFVAATHRKINEDVITWMDMERSNFEETDKYFRTDLYYRLSIFELFPTALRQRKMDIPLLVRHLSKDKMIEDKEEFEVFIKMTQELPLYGNVRELQRLVERYFILGEMPK